MLSDAPAVLVRGLRKTYNGVEAVRGIDLHIARGEIFAFLGPNGAGKTTAVEILEGFRQRTLDESRYWASTPSTALVPGVIASGSCCKSQPLTPA